MADVCAAVQCALAEQGVDMPEVHLSVPAWGLSLPAKLAYSFAPDAAVAVTLGHYGLGAAVFAGDAAVLPCALLATAQPAPLPPAAQLLGASTVSQPVHQSEHGSAGTLASPAAASSAEGGAASAGDAPGQETATAEADDAEGAAAAEPAAAQAQLVDAATPVDAVPAPEMTFPVLGFSSTDKNPYSKVEGNRASSVKWGSVMCVLKDSAGLSSGKHSWAFRVSQKGSRGGVCIGVGSAEFNASTKNLGPALHSWGYSSSGKRSAGYPEFLDYAEGFGQDDVVGVHLDCDAGTLAFSKNGRYLGVAFTDLQGKSVFPAVCMGGRSSSSKRQQLPHELEVLLDEAAYAKAVQASQLQAPADKPSFHFAWQLPVAADDAQHAQRVDAKHVSVGGGGWDLALPSAAAPSQQPGADAALLAVLQHPPMGVMSDSNPTGRHEFGFDCQDVPSGAVLWFVLASSAALDSCTQELPGLYALNEGVCKPGVWAISSEGHVVQNGELSEQRVQWPEGVQFASVRNVGLVFGLPAVDPATVAMTKDVPHTDLPPLSIVLDHKHAVVPPQWDRDALWDACLADGGVRVGVASLRPTADDSKCVLQLRSNEIARMISFDRANSHIKVSMGGSTAQCAAQWASAPLAHSGMTRGKHVWSFKIKERGAMGGICIGVARTDFEFKSKNVGAYRGSWGWSSSGTKGHGEGSFVAYGEGYGTGDVVGVELDADEGTLRFHKNGVDQGVAFATGLKGLTLLPAVCLGGVRSSSKSSKSSSTHALQLYPSHCGVQQLQASADAAMDVASAAAIGDTPPASVKVHPGAVEVHFPEGNAPQHSGVTVAAGPPVLMAAGELPGKASWRFRVDALRCDPAAGADTLRDSLQHALPEDGEDMPGALQQLVRDWQWMQRGTAHDAALQAHYAKAMAGTAAAVDATVDAAADNTKDEAGATGNNDTVAPSEDVQGSPEPTPSEPAPAADAGGSDAPAADAGGSDAPDTQALPEKQRARVHMGVTIGIATDRFLQAAAASPVGVGCDTAGESLGITSSGLLVRAGTCAWLSKSRSILRPFQFLQEGDVITLAITPQEPPAAKADGGAAAGSAKASKADGGDGGDGTTIIRLKDMQPLSSLGGGGDGGGQFFSQLSAGPTSGPVKLQDAALTTSGSPLGDFQAVQPVTNSSSGQLTTEVSATAEAEPREASTTPVQYTVSLSLNGQELCSPVPSELLPPIVSGQRLAPVVTLGGGMQRVKLTLLTNAVEADAAVAASQVPTRIPRPCCSFVGEQQLPLPLSSMSQDGLSVVFSRHWATVPIMTGTPLPQPPAAAGAWSPTHGLSLNSGVHAFHAMVRAKAEGGAVVLGFVSAAPDSPFKWGQWHLGANSGSFGVSSAGDVGGGMQRSGSTSDAWRSFGTEADGKSSSATAAPLFRTGSVVTWFVDTDVSDAQPHARVGVRVDSDFTGLAFTIPASAFPIVPAVCGGGANGVSRHALQLLPMASALDRSQASKRAVLGSEDRLITCTTSWASAFVQVPGIRSGKHSVYWKLLSQAPAGAVCVGVADLHKFHVTARNVGADSHSWGYSSSGKLSAAKSGEFLDYGAPYRMGDIVGVHLDADAAQLNFSVNGVSQGTALGSVLKSIGELVPALCVGSSRSGTPHSVKLLPMLTQEQVAHSLARGWRESWTPVFSSSASDTPSVDGTPVLVNVPELPAVLPTESVGTTDGV